MEVVKKQKSISKVFAFYLVFFCIAAIILMAIEFILFGIGYNYGVILPANYYEQQIEKNRKDIANVKDVSGLIPNDCAYAVYDLKGNVIQGNVTEEKSQKMWDVIQNGEISYGHRYYKTIQRDGEVCIIEYTLLSTFSNPILKKYIPSIELTFILAYFILFIIEVIIFSKSFKKTISKEIEILKDTTKNIQMENLEFTIKSSHIVEINEVLSALDKMKAELNESLREQWKMETTRKEQIAALAHDVKTPLTVIKGNSELLNESELNLEQKEFNYSILNAVGNIESYIKSLMEIIKSEKKTIIQKKQMNLEKFIHDIVELGQSMSMGKNIKFINEVKNIPEFIFADEEKLKRAIINVISNSVDYCELNGEILFSASMNNKNLEIIIEDSGKGFSKEELQFATQQFFQGDKSRHSKNHYGMGLYIVRKFIEEHNGKINLKNSKRLGGAKTILEVPLY